MKTRRPTYQELLRRPEWLRKRADIIELYKSTCQHCRTITDLLTVHHRYYVAGRMPWQYPDWALIPVCDTPCHGLMHRRAVETFDEWETSNGASEPIPEVIIPPKPEPIPEIHEPIGEEAASARFAAIYEMLENLK